MFAHEQGFEDVVGRRVAEDAECPAAGDEGAHSQASGDVGDGDLPAR